MKRILLAQCAALFMAAACASTAHAHWPFGGAESWAACRGQSLPWHNAYYHAAFGEPYALVVPPTAEFQSNYGWGVGGTRVEPIYHQFGRYPGGVRRRVWILLSHARLAERHQPVRRVLHPRAVVSAGRSAAETSVPRQPATTAAVATRISGPVDFRAQTGRAVLR